MNFPRRKSLQVSLRAFLLIVALLAVWLSTVVRRAHNQKTAVETIELVGGRVRFDYEPDMEEHIRRNENRRKALSAGKIPPTYVDGPKAPSWLVDRLGIHFFARVRTVYLTNTRCTNNDLAALQLIPNLKALHLKHVPCITSDGLAAIHKVQLETLVLDGNRYSDETGETGMNDTALVHLAAMRSLKNLSLNQNRFTDEGLKHISNLTRLESLGIEGTKVTASGLSHLTRLRRLKSLRLPNIPIDDAVLKRISTLVALKHLGRPLNKSVTDEGLASLQGFNKLRLLNLRGTQVSDAGLEVLKSMPKLRHLNLAETQVGDDGIQHIVHLNRLETLRLDGTSITDRGAEFVASCSSLEAIGLNDTAVGDLWLKHLSGLKSLGSIEVGQTRVSDAGLAFIAKAGRVRGSIQSLRSLFIGESNVTDAGIPSLIGLTNLEKLILQRVPITDDGLMALAKMGNLGSLRLRETKVTISGLDRLANAMPNCKISADVVGWPRVDTDK